MTPERWKRLKTIFAGALDQPEPRRNDWVVRACEGDETLVSEVRKLLHSHETGGDFLVSPPILDDDVDALAEGTQLGPYRIVREIGRGGMGVVYLARDEQLERDVALKTVRPIFAADDDLRQRLRREARVAAAIEHQAIATVYKLEQLGDHLIIVSEYVPGETLRDIIAGGPLSPPRAHHIGRQIAQALAAAHEAGVVHRDLKPENVIVRRGDTIKVVDFGIAFVEIPGMAALTRTGVAMGTPKYMPPEQLAGEAVDARADIYAFGVVLHEMLTGRHPLTSGNSITDPAIARIIARCVRTNREERYASGADLVRALTNDTAITPAPDTPAGTGSPRWWWEFHQAMAAAVYWVTVWPAWLGQRIVGGVTGRVLFIATLIAIIVAANLRLHLWFTSRFYPADLRWARRREGRWIRAADWLFVGSLAATGIMIGDERSAVAIILIALAAGAAVAFLAIERGTARAAFFTKETRKSKGAG